MWLGRTRHVHFVGIGGIGMSGIAELLANMGYRVSGSDIRTSDVTERLASMGVEVFAGHHASNVGTADVIVLSSAIDANNPEVVAARDRHVPAIPRAEMLAELMRLRVGIAVAGAHGKTTTTTMIALVLERGGLDPTAVIGGRVSAFGSNARLGQGQFIVVEADESDRSFLKLAPTLAVVTNLDHEHLEAYGTFDRLVDAFVDFADRVPFYGAVVACADDPPVRQLLPRMTRRVVTYGFSPDADVRGIDPVTDGVSGRCAVAYVLHGVADGTGTGEISLPMPGRHNLQNALASVAVGLELGVPFDSIRAALATCRGAERRYQERGTVRGVRVVDDYGHHPTELAAVLRAARDGNPGRIIAVFQPHRYSRTRDLLHAFGPALSDADVVVLTDIYGAGEAPIEGISIESLAEAMRATVPDLRVVKKIEDVPREVARLARPNDIVLTLGAGSITRTAGQIVDALEAVH